MENYQCQEGRMIYQETEGKKKFPIDSPEKAYRLLKDISRYKKEYFMALYLDTKNCLLKKEVISIGSLDASLVHPREVFLPAVMLSAAGIILSHNHPSGDPEPSRKDLDLTLRLVEAGKILGIEVIDHLIIGKGSFVSFKERGDI